MCVHTPSIQFHSYCAQQAEPEIGCVHTHVHISHIAINMVPFLYFFPDFYRNV